MNATLPIVSDEKCSLPQCRECRGFGFFTVLAKDKKSRSKVTCPACHGRGARRSTPFTMLVAD